MTQSHLRPSEAIILRLRSPLTKLIIILGTDQIDIDSGRKFVDVNNEVDGAITCD